MRATIAEEIKGFVFNDSLAMRLVSKMFLIGMRKKSSGKCLSKLADENMTSSINGGAVNGMRGLYADPDKKWERCAVQHASSMHRFNKDFNSGADEVVRSISADNYFKLDFGDIMSWLIMVLISNNEGIDKYGCTLEQLNSGMQPPMPIKLAFALDGGKQSEHKGILT